MGQTQTGETTQTDAAYIQRRIKAYQIAHSYANNTQDTQYIQRRINALKIALTYATQQTHTHTYN